MRNHPSSTSDAVAPSAFSLLALLALLLLPAGLVVAPTAARAGSFHETFTSDVHEDHVETTADWNLGLGQLRLFPLSHPGLGQNALPGTAFDVASDGRYAYLAAGSAGLLIESLANPSYPVMVGSYDTPGSAMAVVVRSGRAFVADGAGGLVVVDVSDPASPVRIAGLATPDTCFDVDVEGAYAYLALGLSGVESVNISNPASPAVAGSQSVPGRSVAVAVNAARNQVFVASGQAALYWTGTGALGGLGCCPPDLGGGSAVDVACDEAGVYVADGLGGVRITDVHGSSVTGSVFLPGVTTRVACKDGVAVVANSVDGLDFIDVRDTVNPVKIGAAALGGTANGVALTGEVAYVAEGAGGLESVRKAVPNPLPQGMIGGAASFTLTDLRFYENHAYGVGYPNGIEVYGVDRNRLLRRRGSAAIPSYFNPTANAVDVAGTRAYVAAGAAGLAVFDVSDENYPAYLTAAIVPGFSAYDVKVVNNIAYVAGTSLLIYDVTNPTPFLLSTTGFPPYMSLYRFDVSAKRLYAATSNPSGLRIYDVSNPASPTLLGQYNSPAGGSAFSCAVQGNLAALCLGYAGTEIINVQNPASPVRLALIPQAANDYDVYDAAFSGTGVILGTYLGLRAFDLSNPSVPRLVSTVDLGVGAYQLALRGERVFVANGGWDANIQYAQLDQHFWDPNSDRAQSLTVGPGVPVAVQRVRVTATGATGAAPGVSLEASTNGGASWEATANGTWVTLANAGTDLLWRATLSPTGVDGATNPVVDDLVVDWRTPAPLIASLRDVPNDQGKQVRLDWEASALDTGGSTTPILSYAVYRQIDPQLAAVQPWPGASQLSTMSQSLRTQVESLMAAGWDFVTQVPAVTDDEYAMVVPTLKDSTIASGPYLTTFRVLGLTASPGVNFPSAPDSGYSLDNLAPSVPSNLLAQYQAGKGDSLSWDASTAPDFQYYRVYRSGDPSFTPSPTTLVQSTATNHWIDPRIGETAYYKVTATDFAGNESKPASVAIVTGVGGPTARLAFALHANVPNPLVGTTAIRFTLPEEGARVALRIYDVRGSLVRTLVDGPQSAGEHALAWDARDDAGRPVGAGIFLCTLTAPGHSATRKMLVVR